jgi:hypothetical protein
MELTVSKKCAGRVLSATGIKKIKIGVGLSDRHFFYSAGSKGTVWTAS